MPNQKKFQKRKSEYIATNLGLTEEEIQVAKLIALLHDIGRFEQVKLTEGFIDNNHFDHADYGAEILFKGNMIRKFIDENKYDEIIKKAIYNHNKLKIEKDLDEKQKLHCQIIRDADKLDNFRAIKVYGRIQSREYNKKYENGEEVTKVAYELSICDLKDMNGQT